MRWESWLKLIELSIKHAVHHYILTSSITAITVQWIDHNVQGQSS